MVSIFLLQSYLLTCSAIGLNNLNNWCVSSQKHVILGIGAKRHKYWDKLGQMKKHLTDNFVASTLKTLNDKPKTIMKKFLLPFVAIAVASGLASAQTFNANDWGKDAQTFNNNQAFCYGDDGKSLTVELKTAEKNGLRRAEIANTVPVTLGGEKTVVVFKVTYENARFIDFDKNMIYVRRQMRNTSNAASDVNAIAPYFITNQNSNAGRIAVNNKPGDTEAYYWRYLPSLSNENITPTIAPDWTTEFEIPSSFANNKKFTFNNADAWGFSYLGIRLNHSADFAGNADKEENKCGDLGDDTKATFNYIGIVSLSDLGYESSDAFNADGSGKQGSKVKAYIESILNGTTTGIESICKNENLTISVTGSAIIAPDASKIEVYSLTGSKVIESFDGSAEVSSGLYIVKVYGDNGTAVRKIEIR